MTGENTFDMRGSSFRGSLFGTNTVHNHSPAGPTGVVGSTARPAGPVPFQRRVFVVYGRDEQARLAMFGFLRELDLLPLEWEALVDATGTAAPHVLDVVRAGFAAAAAVVVLFTPDDFAVLHESLRRPGDLSHENVPSGRPRANTLFEAGMAMALHPDRTILVQIGPLPTFSDVHGLDFVQLDGSPQSQPVKLKNIAQRLARAGCQVDTRGDGWLEPTRFAGLAALGRTG